MWCCFKWWSTRSGSVASGASPEPVVGPEPRVADPETAIARQVAGEGRRPAAPQSAGGRQLPRKPEPESAPIRADNPLQLGGTAAVVRRLFHLPRPGRRPRISRGVRIRATPTRIDLRAPSMGNASSELPGLWGETRASTRETRPTAQTDNPESRAHSPSHLQPQPFRALRGVPSQAAADIRSTSSRSWARDHDSARAQTPS